MTPTATNPVAVKVNAPHGTAGPITLKATVQEVADGSLGDIGKAVPVTVTLTPVIGTATIACPVTTTGSGVGGTLNVTAICTTVPVNVYDVAFTVGGNYYQGDAHSKLAVYDPKAGNVDGNGKLPHNGVTAAANVHGEYDDDGLRGHVKYSEDRTTGDVKLESTSLSSMSVVGNAVVILGKAKLNGVANYTFQAIVIDNGEPGTKDLFGLKVFDPTGAAVASLTFSPVNLTGGNFEVQHGDD